MGRRVRNRVISIRFVPSTGKTVDYVDRRESEIGAELARIRRAVHESLRMLRHLLRLRNPVVVAAYTQLLHCMASLEAEPTPEAQADEIARLSQVMEQVVALLNQLTNCRVTYIQSARFTLTYGQSPKKRDLASYNRGKHQKQGVDDEYDELGHADDEE